MKGPTRLGALTVRQDPNDHDVLADFRDDVPGYLNSERVAKALAVLMLVVGAREVVANMRKCSTPLIAMELVGREEEDLPAQKTGPRIALIRRLRAPPPISGRAIRECAAHCD
jgi:hypothetical protein